MATNLRLRADAEEAVRNRAAETGQSQQEVIREAVDRYLGLHDAEPPRTDGEALVAQGRVLPARSEYREIPAEDLVRPADGRTTLELLDRDDRV